MTKLVNRCVVATIGAVLAFVPQAAFAQEGAEKTEGAGASGSVSLGGAGASTEVPPAEADRPAGEAAEKEEEGKFTAGVDLVIGFGKTPIASQVLPGTNSATVPDNVVAPGRINTESFIVGGEYEITKNWGVGARMPLTFGNFTPPGQNSRGTTALGALELEGAYTLKLNDQMKLIYALGVSLPTAQGDEVPTQEDLDKIRGPIDQGNYDRFAVNHAASASRAFEESALFESKRLGFIPKVVFDYNANKILIQPYVKLENLISTVSGAEHSFIGELILGTFLGYRVHQYFDTGVRVWANVPYSGGGDTVAAVEPQIRGHIGRVMPVLGGVIPFAGLTDPQFGGIRLAVAANF